MTPSPDYKALWEQAQAENERLRQELEQSRHQSLLEGIGDSVFAVDLSDYTIMDVNSHAARRLGYTPDELIGLPLDRVETQANADDLLEAFAWSSEISGTYIYECQHRHKDGHLMPVEVSSRVVQIKGKDVLLSCVRIIEDRKRAVKQQLALNLEKERRNLLANFIQDAAHEFRTPLSVIGTSAYLLARQDDRERRQTHLESIALQIKRISRLVDNLLLLTQLENCDKDTWQPVNTTVILRELCQQVCTKHPQHTVVCDIPENLPPVFGNQDVLQGAIWQLFDNACRFTPVGGQITLTARAEANDVQIDIHDNGTGIERDDLPHIFKTFWRKDTAHSTPGFGLGLSIAQRILEHHAGSLTIESEIGQGTRCHVTLPGSH